MATINGSSGQANYSFWAEVSETIPSDYITGNYTYVNTTIKIKNGGSRTDTNGWTLIVNVNGNEVFKDTSFRLNTYHGATSGYYEEFTLVTINNIRINHETNGSKTITVSAELYKSGTYASYDPGHCYIPASGVSNSIQLTTIPRYTTITSFNVSKIDETSIRVTWDAANTCDRVRYRLNSGGWSTPSFSKNFVINNLNANTQYNVEISVRRSDSQLDTDSDPKSVTTYAYPSIRSNGVPSFVIGNDFNILLDNPLGRTCNVTLIGNDNSEKAATATHGSTINEFNTNEWITFFNNSLPSSVEGNYKIRLECSTGNINIESNTSKYYIDTNDTTYKPIFTDQNIINVQNSGEYASISGTNKFIKNHNNLIGEIVKMTPQKGSNGNYYEISATGIETQRKTYSDDNNISFSLENVSFDSFFVTAYDSRSIFYTKVGKNINLIDYNNPTINSNSVNISRQDVIGDKAIIDISGSYTDWENLLEDNTIQSIKYRIGDSGSFNDFPSGSDIDVGNGDWSVYTILEDTFDVRTSYNLYFQVTDLLETIVFGPYVLSTADAFIWKDLQNRYIGVNKKPTCELDINGAAKFSKTSRNYNNGALVGAKEVSATTMSDIISELRYTNGQIGSFNLQTAYTLNSITIPTGWYNYTWMPHRFGGNSGQATGDNCNYGTLFMTGMNTQNGPYIVHFINQQIDCVQDLQSSGGGGGYQSLPLGSIVQYTSVNNIPEGWMTCDGSAISRTTYSDLFALIGTTYGTGDGSTTFNLPDLRSRAVFGYDSSDTDFNSLNKKGGAKTHTHDLSNHTHTSAWHEHTLSRSGWAKINPSANSANLYFEGITDCGSWTEWWRMPTSGKAVGSSDSSARAVALGGKTDGTTPGNTGGPSNNTSGSGSSLPKYITLNYIIKVENTTPLVGSVVDNLDGESTTNAPSVRAVKEALENGGGGGGGVDAAPVGTLSPFVGDTAPSGYLFCQGQLVSKSTYADLYAICGNTFGTATETEFYLPDLRGRVIAGYKAGDATFGTLGGLIGSQYLQAHYHDLRYSHPTVGSGVTISTTGSGLDALNISNWNWDHNGTGAKGSASNLFTSVEGSGDSGNIQPTIILNWMVKAKPTVLLEKLPLGTILEFPFTTNIPDGWHLCDGSAISRTTYAELFALIGTTFGTGDGSTTFNLPNKKGRVSVGIDSNDTDFNTIGKTGGSKYLQEHSHYQSLSDSGSRTGVASYNWSITNTGRWYDGSDLTGQVNGTQTGNSGNLQPYIVTNYIIKISQVTTLIGEVVDDMTSDSTTNAPSIHAVNQAINTASKRHVGHVYTATGLYISHTANWQWVKTPLEASTIIGDYFEFDSTNKRLVLKKACTALMISGSYNWYNNNLEGDHHVRIYKNGSSIVSVGYKSSTSSVYYDQISSTVLVTGTFNIGDYFEMYCCTGGTGTDRTFPTSTNFTIEVLE